MTIKGIDLSNNNLDVNITNEVNTYGLEFVIHKATEGTTYVDGENAVSHPGIHGLDNFYNPRKAETKSLGKVWGSYHFFHPAQDAAAQAHFYLDTAQPEDGELVALDVEVTDGLPYDQIASGVKLWLDIVSAAVDKKVLLYSDGSFLKATPTTDLVGSAELWIADPSASGTPYQDRWGKWTIWQTGIVGGYDHDLFNGSTNDLRAFAAHGHPETITPRGANDLVFNPPVVINTPIVSSAPCSTGGAWLLGINGTVWAFNCGDYGAPQRDQRGENWVQGNRVAKEIIPVGSGYKVVAVSGEEYTYLPQV